MQRTGQQQDRTAPFDDATARRREHKIALRVNDHHEIRKRGFLSMFNQADPIRSRRALSIGANAAARCRGLPADRDENVAQAEHRVFGVGDLCSHLPLRGPSDVVPHRARRRTRVP